LSATHVQIDEIAHHVKFHEPVVRKNEIEVQTYQQKIDKALERLREKGINPKLEYPKIPVQGLARQGYEVESSEDIAHLYDDLRKEIDECEHVRSTPRRKPKSVLNIAADAVIAVSSLGHDFFITCDKCLFECSYKVMKKHGMFKERFKIPETILVRRSPNEVAKAILEQLPC